MPLLLEAVTHGYSEEAVLRGIDLELPRGAIGCLLGESGCGKTTVLRCIAGFEALTGGKISLAGHLISRQGMTVDPARRGVGMVFQNGALFPHLSVRENIGFGLRSGDSSTVQARVDELLDLTGLGPHCDAFPHELSGGQQQRVALARALAPNPDLVLLDEPFANLDRHLRRRLAVEVRELLRAAGTTALLVSHDQEEAFTLADEVGVMDGGRIAQWGTPVELYTNPRSRRVAELVGDCSFLQASVDSAGQAITPFGPVPAPGRAAGACVEVLVRPDDIVVADRGAVEATVLRSAFRGAHTLHALRLSAGAEVLAALPSHLNLAVGDRLEVALHSAKSVIFDAVRGRDAAHVKR